MTGDNWQLFKGEEFSLRDMHGEITGFLAHQVGKTATFSVNSGSCDAIRLIVVVQRIMKKLPEYEIYVVLTPAVAASLDELAQAGRLQWRQCEVPSYLAQIWDVKPLLPRSR